ncbi:MAG: phenylalanine--tRNA ligase subunit alpha [Candidatus Marinimicrobia bacterium]|mgnify:CR=1 FL=1|nr:phenylalanine--tRNA ligase subunit alpha [Candidatus Neomarinimicrobiota bacterium]|tara:strand:- start:1351 stop:2373 length:1023 start_codon:yes stop_codon:yes gene_type:complete
MSLKSSIDSLRKDFEKEISATDGTNFQELDRLKHEYLGRKGKVTSLFNELGSVSTSERPEMGKMLNQLKGELHESLNSLIEWSASHESAENSFDLTLPGDEFPSGSLHPITQTMREVKRIFQSIGFSSAYGPEIDDDYHNFEALNFPKHHPARDMQDTFYITENDVLRTHTSNTQIHVMENQQPPVRVICPGRVYRNEAVSVRSYCLFHQIEGLYVNRDVSLAEMKGTLEYFCRQFFGEKVQSRFRPSFFPFTEPSAEVDISCMMCKGKGCSMCKKTGWLEILGCGMVDPAVLEKVGYDSQVWSGYAWGMGIERLAILKYGIDDIRLFFNGDVRFLRQFV